MKKVFKILMYLIVVVIVFVAGAIAYITIFLPNVGKPEDIKVISTPERIEHGKYLATSVMVCMDCHSTRDWSKFSGPPTPNTLGKGGDRFDQTAGFPGVFYARNITPAGIGNWTDGEIFRTITTGVDKNNKALFPIMPYHYYGQLDKEDIYDVISYIKTLPSIKNEVPAPKPDFPFNIIEHLIPHKANLQTKPKESDTLAYGKYMTTASGCVECHTKADKGQIIAGLEFGGGREFNFPFGTLRTANITSDATGIGGWTEEQFVKEFKQYQDTSFHLPTVKPTDYNTIMPWTMYGQMKESDLKAIYAYLRTVKKQQNTVVKFTPKK